ncbi:MAG: acyl-CoA dehydrogenase [Christensenellaceae bacterium]|nr:acyl-CoA dehydrogenase [Christensenellaceae bacterium]
MDFTLTKQQEMMQTFMRKFAQNEVAPLAAIIDQEERHPYETIEKMAKYGIMGTPVPKQYGGAGGDYMSYIIAVEEIAKVCASTADILSTHVSLCCGPIMTYGTEEQKQKYLIPLAKGELLGGFALTEPNAGTDASAQQTVAKLEGDHYVINGSKIFITNGGVADVYVMFCMTDKSKGTKGITAFIIEKDFPGFSIGKKEEKMGLRGSNTAELVFTDMIVPKENVLGEVGRGFNIAMATLDGGRIGIGAQALGIAEGAFDETKKYMKERIQFGKPLSAFQGLQWMAADIEVKIQSAKLLVYKAAMDKQNGGKYTISAAMAKLAASEAAMEVTTKCVQLHGGYGYTRDYPLERMMRDAKITEIYEGTSQVQRMVISGSLFR